MYPIITFNCCLDKALQPTTSAAKIKPDPLEGVSGKGSRISSKRTFSSSSLQDTDEAYGQTVKPQTPPLDSGFVCRGDQ